MKTIALSAPLPNKARPSIKAALRYALYIPTHPFDGFWDLTHEKRGSLGAAHVIVAATVLVEILKLTLTNFQFIDINMENFNAVTVALRSVEKGAYEYALVEGGLEVSYTVGNIPRIYYFPAAATAERMNLFWDQLGQSEKSRLEASYRLVDLEKLQPSDNRTALVTAYPDLEEGPLYILRDTTREYMKAQIEEFFAAAGYTREDYAEDSVRYRLAENEIPLFSITIRYELEGNALLVSVPFDRVQYRAAYPITQLNLLPFFGTGGREDEGYILVPDGSGALINFNNGRQNQIAYNNNVYGWDEGMLREAVISDNKAPYPVFGLLNNGAAFICVIEEGASYAGVRADVSGRNCSYNSVSAQFALVHGATMDISAKSDKAVYLYEAALPKGERILERFIFCAGDGYVGMAKEYRSYLQKKHPGAFRNAGEGGVPAAVEILGAVNKTQHRLGIPFDLPLKLTSYQEAAAMIEDFAGGGGEGAAVAAYGVWINTGYAYAAPYADMIVDMALGDQGFGITDVSVPFYPIALHGLVPYAGRAINLAEDYTRNILESVEAGAGLYFSFMTEESAVLQETKFRQFYANEYGKWAGDADALYQRFRKDFWGLYGQTIANHEILAPGVRMTEYEKGTRVLVNYGETAYDYRGLTVGANSYAVIK